MKKLNAVAMLNRIEKATALDTKANIVKLVCSKVQISKWAEQMVSG